MPSTATASPPEPPPLPQAPSVSARSLLQSPGRDRDALILAVVAVVFLHLLFLAAVPRQARLAAPVEMAEVERMQLELLQQPLEEEELQYVRANPAAEAAPPDETNLYSDRDQVAAQEEVTPLAADETPAQEGDEAESVRLVQGDPFQQPAPPAPASQQAQQSASSPPIPEMRPAPAEKQQVTAPDVLERGPLEEDGLLATPEPQDNAEEPEEIETADTLQPTEQQSELDDVGQDEFFRPERPAVDPSQRQPRPNRPQVALDNSFGPRRDAAAGVNRIGNVSWNTRYSEFGEYWKRVTEVIERRWNSLVMNSYRSLTFSGDRVVFEFVIARDGSIKEIHVIQSGVGRFEETLARDAIESTAPYFPWTPEMIATMGEETDFSLGFIY
ncbi:MAG: hypothetical protein ACLFR7_00385 [Opitutales bacterium]